MSILSHKRPFIGNGEEQVEVSMVAQPGAVTCTALLAGTTITSCGGGLLCDRRLPEAIC